MVCAWEYMWRNKLIYIVFNILNLEMFHFVDIYFCSFSLPNLKAIYIYFFFSVSLPTDSSKLTDIRHNAFNCLTGKTAETWKQSIDRERRIWEVWGAKCTQHLKQPQVSCHDLKLDPSEQQARHHFKIYGPTNIFP